MKLLFFFNHGITRRAAVLDTKIIVWRFEKISDH